MGLSERLADWVRGYVVIRAAGEGLPAFVNHASRGGVELKRLRRPGRQVLVAQVAAHQYRRLRRPARQAGVSVRVVRRRGLPFLLRRLARRPGLLAGAVVAAAIMAVLNSRIWAVEVRGLAGDEAQRLRAALLQMGVRPGAARSLVEPRQVEDQLLATLPDLAWVDVRLEGSRAVVEARARRDEQRRELAPGDLVASADGLVVQVVAAAGWPLVAPGDVVRRGQVLVSGRPPLGAPPGARPVRAAGRVYARVWAEGFAQSGLEQRIERPSGRTAAGVVVSAGPWQLRLGAVDPPFLRFRTQVSRGRLPAPLAWLPLRWDRVVHQEMEEQRFALEPEQARRLVEEQALEQAASRLGPAPEVLDRRVQTWEEQTGDGQRLVRSRAVIEAVQDVAAFVPHPREPASLVPPSPAPDAR